MRNVFLAMGLFLSLSISAQWTTILPDTRTNRIDDICFLDYQNGFAIRNTGHVYKTNDGGKTWSSLLLNDTSYFRTIEFSTPNLGFIGTLDRLFYRTTDGGKTWEDIYHKLDTSVVAICGLSAPTPNVIYGTGAFYHDGYIIKSTDWGQTWSYIDMSAYASALVDIHFVSQDTGFVTGRAQDKSEGGIILYTTDGGVSWTEKIKTNRADEYVWKIQSPDGKHFFGAIEPSGISAGKEIYFLKSNDAGLTWTKDTLSNTWSYVQAIGFLDSLHGWSGGNKILFETKDGGETWHVDTLIKGNKYNRFIRIDNETGFLTGESIYLTSPGTVSVKESIASRKEVHELIIRPNPTANDFIIELKLGRKTNCLMELFSAEGKLLETIEFGKKQAGEFTYDVALEKYNGNMFFVSLKTNEKHYFAKVIRVK